MSKKISRNVKRRLKVFGPFIIVVLLFCTTSIASYFYKIYSLKMEERTLKNELKELKDKEENLKDEIAKLKDPDYIAKYARENYYYTKNGEYVIKINEDEKTEEKIETKTNPKIYYVIGLVIIILNILIFILLKVGKNKKDE